MTWLAIISGLSLFSGLDYRVGGVIVRPFDFMVVIMGLALLAKVAARGSLKVPPGVLWLVPFSVITALSAATVSMGNGLREGVQMCVVLVFALAYANADEPAPRGATWVFLFCAMWALMLFNIGWHVSEGYYTGWKRLNELKHTVGLTILLTVAWIAMRQFRATMLQLLVFGILGGIVVMSGERKSLIIYVVGALTIMSSIGLRRSLQVLIIPIAIMALTVMLFADDYMLRHIESLSLTTESSPEGVPTSSSNQQRAFALKAGWDLFEASPVIGVGTNAYEEMVKRAFANYPDYYLKGIHSEFFRILVENGLLGFVAYVLIWIVSIVRTLALARALRVTGRLDRRGVATYRRFYVMFFATAAVICGLEASGTDLFLLMLLVSLWPDLSRAVFLRQTTHARMPVAAVGTGGAR